MTSYPTVTHHPQINPADSLSLTLTPTLTLSPSTLR